jgi:hypothetical protein
MKVASLNALACAMELRKLRRWEKINETLTQAE